MTAVQRSLAKKGFSVVSGAFPRQIVATSDRKSSIKEATP